MGIHDYKGYTLTPTPHLLTKNNEWQVHVLIAKDRKGDTIYQDFPAKDAFISEEEAITHSLEFGRQIVDGRFPEFKLAE